MGDAKVNVTAITTKGAGAFSQAYVSETEQDRCINHSVAFERIFGWPIHVTLVGSEVLRCHNEGNQFQVYDVRGILDPCTHGQRVIEPVIMTAKDRLRSMYPKGVPTEVSCCGEEGLAGHGIECDEELIERCGDEIRSNLAYCSIVPRRPLPWRSADTVRRYAFACCLAFAEALSRTANMPAVVLMAKQTIADLELGSDRFHAGLLHADGTLEDVWGRHPVDLIARGYGMVSWAVSQTKYQSMVRDAYRDVPTFEADVTEAMSLLQK